VSDAAASVPTTGQRLKRMVLLLLFAVAVGPPVGSVVFFTVSGMARIHTLEDAGYALLQPFVGLLFAPFSYLLGAVPAALGGLVVAAWQAFLGRVSALGITAVGFVLGLAFVYAMEGFRPLSAQPAEWGRVIGTHLTAMLPTIACWYPMRKRYYPPVGSARGAEQAAG
jgi:hypothetical protein